MNDKALDHAICLGIPTSGGVFTAHYSDAGLSQISFPSAKTNNSKNTQPMKAKHRAWHPLVVSAIKNILAGKAAGELPPLDVSSGTDFQRSVWRELRRIKTGQTQSYGEIAKSIGNKNAVRAVGGACGANPIPLIIPCHRVLAANRKIGGFSGGVEWKQQLLAIERIVLGD